MIAVLSALVLGANGTMAGVLVAVALGIVPAFKGLSPTQYIQVHRLVGRHYDRVMPPLVISCTVADIVLAAVVSGRARIALFVAAALAQLGVSLVSQFANVPINRTVKNTEPQSIGDDWDDPRARWANWHLTRTVLALCAVAANTAGVATLR
ncbi:MULTISPECIES: DUF1772 domain-containing protein [Kitasatospora]|uniref:DUF1772 domain-containing protein n=1 Tax=Kitasatospora cystarginea TaxID=58350 RepID=A0ABN3EWR3_9ACTN